jgi:spore germination protein GerM
VRSIVVALLYAASYAQPGPVYLVHGHLSPLGWRGRLVAEPRREARSARAALLALLRGPTVAERRRGITSALPSGTRAVGLRVSHGAATVGFDGGSRRAWLEGGFYATAQVVYTLTARPGIERVWMRVRGRRCCVFDHSGRPFARPLTRAVFAGWQGAP